MKLRGAKQILFLAAGIMLAAFSSQAQVQAPTAVDVPSDPLGWPAATRECHPWTRWWWLGSAVDETNLTHQLELFKQAGLGGVEICPIYGAHGYEDKFINFLSPKWVSMFEHTTREAKRLGLGVDMTTGTGWPFGGPGVSKEDASAKVVLQRYEVKGGEKLNEKLPSGILQCVIGVSDAAAQTNLTSFVQARQLTWDAPVGKWKVYAVLQDGPLQQVKRAAPGGEGNVLNPYSTNALAHYLAGFDKAFADFKGEMPRCEFHDSFEYYGAQWAPEFLGEFSKRRGYDLCTQIPALFGDGDADTVARVQCDYRETISDLHLEYVRYWTAWSHSHGSMTREQAHGSPGNLLDIYAAADIPETETFPLQTSVTLNKFSSSAAHLTGRKLASSESFTWLNEHFSASFSQVKQAADFFFLVGVNHIFFHGIPYSPQDAPWPGWQFYAAVNFGPNGGLWHDLPQFTAYVTRCESILQSGNSANDVLLYYPVHSFWQADEKLMIQNPMSKSFTNTAIELWERGYAFDHLSDAFLAKAVCKDGGIELGGGTYRAIVVPACEVMPVESFEKLLALAKDGATIVFQNGLPKDVPGFGDLEKRRSQFRELIRKVSFGAANADGIKTAMLEKGRIISGPDADTMLHAAGVWREEGADLGLKFVRRSNAEGMNYFVANRGDKTVDGWVTLATGAKSAVILDPRYDNMTGVAATRNVADGRTQIYLQLEPGESCFVKTFSQKQVEGQPWNYYQSSGEKTGITGVWKIDFIEGGPELPGSVETNNLGSWTAFGGNELKRFAGTARYTIEFDHPSGEADDWLLDLGRVGESASIKLNGQPVGSAWCAPFHGLVGALLHPGRNKLEVEVTNLAANRIADMDRRKVKWKYFYNANVASRSYGALDASNWKLKDSGLEGPVFLQPLKKLVLGQ